MKTWWGLSILTVPFCIIMKKYKVLNVINSIALLYLPIYALLTKSEFFYSKSADVVLPMIAMFITTFVCSGLIQVKSVRSGLDNSLSLVQLKLIDKRLLVYVMACFVIGNVLNFIFVNDDIKYFYLAFSFICSVFVLIDNVIIKLMTDTKMFRLTTSLLIKIFPFFLFLAIMIMATMELFELSEKDVIALFVFFVIYIIFVMWFMPDYVVDVDKNTIEVDNALLPFIIKVFKNNPYVFNLNNVRCFTNTRFCYIIHFDEQQIKIPKFYIHTKDLFEILEDKGIPLSDL